MPSFVPSDGRQGPDYRSNLHVPGMDSVPDTEVFESPEQTADKSFSTFGKETPLSHQHLHLHHHHHHQNHHLLKNHHLSHHQGSLERKELEAFLPSSRAPYNPAYLSEYCVLLRPKRPPPPRFSDLVIELGEKEKDSKFNFLPGLAGGRKREIHFRSDPCSPSPPVRVFN